MSGDKSVVMEFNSDSDDDDDDDGILRDLMSHHRPRQNLTNGSRGGSGGGGRKRKDVLSPTRKSLKQSGSDHGSIFSESDEDFCVIDAPTITKVVSARTEHTYSVYMESIYLVYVKGWIYGSMDCLKPTHTCLCIKRNACLYYACIGYVYLIIFFPGTWGQAADQMSAGEGREN